MYQGCKVTKTSHLPIHYFLALLWAHPILHISTIRVNLLSLCNTCINFTWIWFTELFSCNFVQFFFFYVWWTETRVECRSYNVFQVPFTIDYLIQSILNTLPCLIVSCSLRFLKVMNGRNEQEKNMCPWVTSSCPPPPHSNPLSHWSDCLDWFPRSAVRPLSTSTSAHIAEYKWNLFAHYLNYIRVPICLSVFLYVTLYRPHCCIRGF